MSRKRVSSSRGQAASRVVARKSAVGWRTTDADEVARRVDRAKAEPMAIANLDAGEPFYGTFAVVSEGSGMPYQVEIRSLTSRQNSCTCPDFRVNGLGTCKHVEAVLNELGKKPRLFKRAAAAGSPCAIPRRRQSPEPNPSGSSSSVARVAAPCPALPAPSPATNNGARSSICKRSRTMGFIKC